MDPSEPVSDDTAWRLAAAYIDAWNRRDRDAWLETLHPEIEFRPTALVGKPVVHRGLDGARRYFDALLASGRAEQAEITGLRRIAPDRILIELELLIDGGPVGTACVVAQVRDARFVHTSGYLSDAQMLATTGLVPGDASAIERPDPEPAV